MITVMKEAGVGIKTYWVELQGVIDESKLPGAAVFYRVHRETRESGGAGHGTKRVRPTISIVLTTVGTQVNSTASGEAHRQLAEDVIAAIANADPRRFGCISCDKFDYTRQPPLSDSQGIAYLTFIDIMPEGIVDG